MRTMVLEYLPTAFTAFLWPSHVGKYSSTIEHLGYYDLDWFSVFHVTFLVNIERCFFFVDLHWPYERKHI